MNGHDLSRGLLLLLPLLAIILTGCPDVIDYDDYYDGAVVVDDQEVDGDGDIVIRSIGSYGGEWLAIHRDDNGAPLMNVRPIGGILYEYDNRQNLKVRLDSAVSPGERLWAVLHADMNVYGRFDYGPGDSTDYVSYDYYSSSGPWDDFIVR
jgi:hypothetical protein